MADQGAAYTDKELAKMEKKIKQIYSEAQSDIEKKLADFNEKFVKKSETLLKQVNEGKITYEQYSQWLDGQIFQSEQWESKKKQIIGIIQNANKEAANILNGGTINVFAENANWSHYQMEHTQGVNFGFGLYDAQTVTNLVKNDPQVLPKWKVNEKKDYVWNAKKVNNSITQGIIQGEALDKIADRLATSLKANNMNTMLTFARTAMTGAQNAGRYQSQQDAKELGINIVKVWMATLDDHTRASHQELDGEEQKVGDKWHPFKFSNGCRYPGDPLGPPHEVYNCRCTLVSDVKDYPSTFKRYDNIEGKPVDVMTYKEWKEAKEALSTAPEIDYSPVGNKDAYDILSKYDKYWDMPWEEKQILEQMYKSGQIPPLPGMKGVMTKSDNLQAYIDMAKNLKPVEPEVNVPDPQEAMLQEAQEKLKDIQQNIINKGADKVFSGIWKDDVTYADWKDKKDSIQAKEEYYEKQIDKYKQKVTDDIFGGSVELYDMIIESHDNLYDLLNDKDIIEELVDWYGLSEDDLKDTYLSVYGNVMGVIDGGSDWNLQKANKLENYLDELKEFEKHGEEYSKLLEELDDAKKLVKDLTPAPESPFGPDAYSQQRKDDAWWAQTSREADNNLREVCGEVWRNATQQEREAIYEYTQSYHKYNEPLRGYEYGTSRYLGVGNTDLNAGWTNNGKRLNAMTSIIDKSSYDHDMWLQRGCRWGGMDKFLQCDMSLLQYGSQRDLENELMGKVVTEYGFMSCGSSKGQGFGGDIMLNVYAPAGTKMMYVEPFSVFGNGSGLNWNGTAKQSSFGGELETILQQGTQFRITKVDKSGGKIWLDIEVIDQSNKQLWQ